MMMLRLETTLSTSQVLLAEAERDAAALRALAVVFEYPTGGASTNAVAAAGLVEDVAPELATALRRLSVWIAADPSRAEEHYTRMFDLAPNVSLHVGWHLFGEDYIRGSLLSQLQVELRNHAIPTFGDLPDFLPLLLRLLAAQEDVTDRYLLVSRLMLPGIQKVAGELKDSTDFYAGVLCALPPYLERWVADDGSEEVRL